MLESVKDFVKPPFANYDVVVYFGGGLFALPLINHYFVEPTEHRFPRFSFDMGFDFANSAVSLLSLLFSVYLLGHIIAYCGSLIVERAMDVFNGKVSSALAIASYVKESNKEKVILSWGLRQISKAFTRGKIIRNLIRIAAHIPVLPLYLVMDVVGGLYYYQTRLPRHILFLAGQKLKSNGHTGIRLNSPWFKTLEHCVINNNPVATTRMYNYLVISGLFRSLSFIFLACIWAEIFYYFEDYFGFSLEVKPLMSDVPTSGAAAFGLFLIYVAYGFSWSSYMKFRRRYAEEAIFAYVLAR